MKKRLNKLTAMLVALVLMASLMPAALAATTVNPEVDEGSITVTLKYGESPLSDFEVTLYRVADGEVRDNNLYFNLLDAFKPAENSGEEPVELNGLNAEAVEKATTELMSKINAMEQEERDALKAGAVKTNEDGVAAFEGLSVGVYIAVQSTSSRYTFSPFMLYLPYTNEDGTDWEFAVDANPKVTYRGGGGGGGGGTTIIIPPDPVPTDPADPPSDPTEGIPEEEPPLAELPQTGLLQWPIPIMAAAGLLLIALGLLSEQKRKAQNS